MFFTWKDIKDIAERIRRTPFEGVSEELRGWRWNEPPVAPMYNVGLGVSDIVSGFCDTGRNVYLKYVLGKREAPNSILRRGSVVHMVHERAVSTAKRLIYSLKRLTGQFFLNYFMAEREKVLADALVVVGEEDRVETEWVVKSLWLKAGLTYSSQLEQALSRSKYLSRETIVSLTIPESAEFAVDGSLIGLSPTLKIDSLLPSGIIVEIKTRPYKPVYELTLAGYALAFESVYEVPIDYGLLLQVVLDRKDRAVRFYRRMIPLGDRVRMEFIERRDRLAEVVANREDPGMPETCSPACPYQHVCNPSPDRVSRRP